ncbi:hypothetical protein F4778DRAFT_778507 [Xylariomycetidae sp. FL2044]|nr:hypothetical protein F4778DRAFT_778507 [Xylariomycetidae sp. FL2044]
MSQLTAWFRGVQRLWRKYRSGDNSRTTEFAGYQQGDDGVYKPLPEDYPNFPPPSPRLILQAPQEYWAGVVRRKYAAPRGVLEDSSLYALYRLYEFIILDKVFDYRNALEAFWRAHTWAIHDIQDPKDGDPERYAFLAGCTYLLVRSFNARVKLGLRRGASSLITPEEAEEARNVPDHLRRYESVPDWAKDVAPLEDLLMIPTQDGELLQNKGDSRADPDFREKNILLWTPHIHFT